MRLLSTVAFILLLLFSLIAGVLFVAPSSANFFPETVPPGIQITSGGSVKGTDRIQRSGDTYTLIGDIYGTIVILRDGIVLDGGGYALQGSGGGTGVFLQERNNVVIQNMKIDKFTYGIKFTWQNYESPTNPRSNTISGNTITNNQYGIAFNDFSQGNQISGNYFENNTYGVAFSYTPNNIFRNNQFRNNAAALLDNSPTANDVDTSNTVNGKPIYYWINQHDKTVPSGAGWVVLKNCSGITVQNSNLDGNGNGILLFYTNSSTISGNTVTNNMEGITLEWSFNNVIFGNRISSNNGYGVSLDYNSNNNTITKNEIAANAKDGVNFGYSTINATVTENYVTENGGNGIFFHDIQASTVFGNNITRNKGCGVGFGYGPSGIIKQNYIAENDVGIWLSNAHENTITWNNIIANTGWGIRLEGSQENNTIHHNNFINNSRTEALQASILGIWTYPGLGKPLPTFPNGTPATPEPPILTSGAASVWDNGKEGNYWSDYTTRYPNASAVGNTGVGDTPYFINENNMDHYPLMNPVADNSASTEQQQESEDSTEAKLPADYTIPIVAAIAIVVMALAASTYFVLKRKKPLRKTLT